MSVGPQSEADAYETLAYREKRRRDSLHAVPREQSPVAAKDKSTDQKIPLPAKSTDDGGGAQFPLKTSRLTEYENMMGTGFDSIPNSAVDEKPLSDFDDAFVSGQRREQNEAEMFSRLERPRVRYDVEVVTKLIVYAGMRIPHVPFS